MLFSDCVFKWLLELLKKEVPEQSRHLVQYFQVFLSYASKGPYEVSLEHSLANNSPIKKKKM